MARDLGDRETLARALLARLWSICWPDTLDERLEIAGELVPLAESLGDRELLLRAVHCSIANLLELGDLAAVRKELDRYARLAEDLRQPLYLWYVALRRAMLANLEGRFDDALELAAAAYTLGQRVQEQDPEALFIQLQVPAMEARGRLHEFVDQYRSSNVPTNAFLARRVLLILIYCKLNRIEEARAGFEQMATDDFAELPYDAVRLITAGNLAEICHLVDDTRHAAALYDVLHPYATHILVNGGLAQNHYGSASRPLGLLATTLGRWDEAAKHFQAAISHDEQMGARPWAAVAREDYGRMLLTRGAPADVEQARALLQQALATYRELGMLPARERAEALLVAAERAKQPERQAYPDGLTPREVEVLRLLAAGESNREIAEQLVLSPRTAERHVAGIYRKIGARRRADAISYALHRGFIQSPSRSSE